MSNDDNKNFPGDDFISANDNINVAEIIVSIKKKIAEKKKAGLLNQQEIIAIENMELISLPDIDDIPYIYESHLFPDSQGQEFKPFQLEPEIEPGLIKKILKKIRPLLLPFFRFMIRPYAIELKDLSVQLHNLNKLELHNLKKAVYQAYQTKEYIVLLHHAGNRLIMEISKLKIENDIFKTRLKMLEDKIEFLENRERQIENKLFNPGVGKK